MIRCDSFSEIPQLRTPDRRDELDGEDCDAKIFNVQREKEKKSFVLFFIFCV